MAKFLVMNQVRGRGVVGQEPILTKASPAFQYSSHVSLQAPSGHMWYVCLCKLLIHNYSEHSLVLFYCPHPGVPSAWKERMGVPLTAGFLHFPWNRKVCDWGCDIITIPCIQHTTLFLPSCVGADEGKEWANLLPHVNVLTFTMKENEYRISTFMNLNATDLKEVSP